MNGQFWKDKRVFVTGHTGFKGAWLCLWLEQLGAKVYGYALAPATTPSLFEAAQVEASLVSSTLGDIRHAAALAQSLADSNADIVLHMAAQPLVRESYNDPLTTLETNVMGTANLLEAVRKTASVKAVVVVTSDKCYLNREWQWGYRENESLGGHDPYSASKACTELVAQSWQQSFFQSECSVATARAGNVIGGGDWSKDRLIPDLLNSINNGKNVVLRNPDAIRPWQHVLEPLSGYLQLAQRLFEEGEQWAEAWNFGPHDSDTQTVSWIVERLISVSGRDVTWERAAGEQPHEAQLLKLDSSKARQVLGWDNVWSIDECVSEIAEWNKHWAADADMREYSLQTIARFS